MLHCKTPLILEYIQSAKKKNARNGDFLGTLDLESPHDWHRQHKDGDIGDDVYDGGREEQSSKINACPFRCRREPRPIVGHWGTLKDRCEECTDAPQNTPSHDGIPCNAKSGGCGAIDEDAPIE